MPTLSPSWVFADDPIPDPEGRAARMLRFADLLRHPSAKGLDRRPLPHRWQRRIVERIYGPSDEHGRRQVRTVFALLPRGARKTTLTSVLALGHTIGPEQVPRGQVFSAAGDRTQARIAFEEAVEMLRGDERMIAATRLRDTKSRIEHTRSRSAYIAISADGDAQHGKTPSFVHADELHVWRGFSLWSALRTGASKTPGSLTIVTTTAGERPEGICWELYQYSLRVLAEPARDPSFLPIIFAADPQADWQDEALWQAVNPGLADGFPDLDELRAEARVAREIPRLRDAFRQTHLNVWTEGGASDWIEMAVYDEGVAPFDMAADGRPAWIGVDLAKSYDLCAVVLVLRDPDGGYTVKPFAFLPETAFRRRMEELPDVPLRAWREAGLLTVLPGDIVDEDAIEGCIRALCDEHDVREIRFDPKFAARLMGRLAEDELPAVECPPTRVVMGPLYAELQRAILARRFRHGGNPLLRWCFTNARVDFNDTGLPFVSKKRSTAAVDPIVGAAMAIGGASAGAQPSLWDDPDFDADALVM